MPARPRGGARGVPSALCSHTIDPDARPAARRRAWLAGARLAGAWLAGAPHEQLALAREEPSPRSSRLTPEPRRLRVRQRAAPACCSGKIRNKPGGPSPSLSLFSSRKRTLRSLRSKTQTRQWSSPSSSAPPTSPGRWSRRTTCSSAAPGPRPGRSASAPSPPRPPTSPPSTSSSSPVRPHSDRRAIEGWRGTRVGSWIDPARVASRKTLTHRPGEKTSRVVTCGQ